MQVEIGMENENEMVVKRLSVPLGLEELMDSLTKEVLRKRPADVYAFASEHFAQLLALRDTGCYKTSFIRIKKTPSQVSMESIKESQKGGEKQSPPIKIKSAMLGMTAKVPEAAPKSLGNRSRNALPGNKSSTIASDSPKLRSDRARQILDKHMAKKQNDKVDVKVNERRKSGSTKVTPQKDNVEIKRSARQVKTSERKNQTKNDRGLGKPPLNKDGGLNGSETETPKEKKTEEEGGTPRGKENQTTKGIDTDVPKQNQVEIPKGNQIQISKDNESEIPIQKEIKSLKGSEESDAPKQNETKTSNGSETSEAPNEESEAPKQNVTKISKGSEASEGPTEEGLPKMETATGEELKADIRKEEESKEVRDKLSETKKGNDDQLEDISAPRGQSLDGTNQNQSANNEGSKLPKPEMHGTERKSVEDESIVAESKEATETKNQTKKLNEEVNDDSNQNNYDEQKLTGEENGKEEDATSAIPETRNGKVEPDNESRTEEKAKARTKTVEEAQKDEKQIGNHNDEASEQNETEVSKEKIENAAVSIQAGWRGYQTRKGLRKAKPRDLVETAGKEDVENLQNNVSGTNGAKKNEEPGNFLRQETVTIANEEFRAKTVAQTELAPKTPTHTTHTEVEKLKMKSKETKHNQKEEEIAQKEVEVPTTEKEDGALAKKKTEEEELLAKSTNAAVKIQAYVRGHLARQKSIYRNNSETNLLTKSRSANDENNNDENKLQETSENFRKTFVQTISESDRDEVQPVSEHFDQTKAKEVTKGFIEYEQKNYRGGELEEGPQSERRVLEDEKSEKSSKIGKVEKIDFSRGVKVDSPSAIEKVAVVSNNAENAAVKIQSLWRGHVIRKHVKNLELKRLQKPTECDDLPGDRVSVEDLVKAATAIQALFRGFSVRKHFKNERMETTFRKEKSFEDKLPTVLEVEDEDGPPKVKTIATNLEKTVSNEDLNQEETKSDDKRREVQVENDGANEDQSPKVNTITNYEDSTSNADLKQEETKPKHKQNKTEDDGDSDDGPKIKTMTSQLEVFVPNKDSKEGELESKDNQKEVAATEKLSDEEVLTALEDVPLPPRTSDVSGRSSAGTLRRSATRKDAKSIAPLKKNLSVSDLHTKNVPEEETEIKSIPLKLEESPTDVDVLHEDIEEIANSIKEDVVKLKLVLGDEAHPVREEGNTFEDNAHLLELAGSMREDAQKLQETLSNEKESQEKTALNEYFKPVSKSAGDDEITRNKSEEKIIPNEDPQPLTGSVSTSADRDKLEKPKPNEEPEVLSRPVSKESTTSADSVDTVIFNVQQPRGKKPAPIRADTILPENYIQDNLETSMQNLSLDQSDDVSSGSIEDKSFVPIGEEETSPETPHREKESPVKREMTFRVLGELKEDSEENDASERERRLGEVKEQSSDLVTDVIDTAAKKIQKFFKQNRGKRRRKSASTNPNREIAEILAQTQSSSEDLHKDVAAATTIQKTYRGFRVRRDLQNRAGRDEAQYDKKEEEIDREITNLLKSITEPVRRTFSADGNIKVEAKGQGEIKEEGDEPNYVYIPLRDYSSEDTQSLVVPSKSRAGSKVDIYLPNFSASEDTDGSHSEGTSTSKNATSTSEGYSAEEISDTCKSIENKLEFEPKGIKIEEDDPSAEPKLTEPIEEDGRGEELRKSKSTAKLDAEIQREEDEELKHRKEEKTDDEPQKPEEEKQANEGIANAAITQYINSLIEPIRQAFSADKKTKDNKVKDLRPVKDEGPIYIPLRDYSDESPPEQSSHDELGFRSDSSGQEPTQKIVVAKKEELGSPDLLRLEPKPGEIEEMRLPGQSKEAQNLNDLEAQILNELGLTEGESGGNANLKETSRDLNVPDGKAQLEEVKAEDQSKNNVAEHHDKANGIEGGPGKTEEIEGIAKFHARIDGSHAQGESGGSNLKESSRDSKAQSEDVKAKDQSKSNEAENFDKTNANEEGSGKAEETEGTAEFQEEALNQNGQNPELPQPNEVNTNRSHSTSTSYEKDFEGIRDESDGANGKETRKEEANKAQPFEDHVDVSNPTSESNEVIGKHKNNLTDEQKMESKFASVSLEKVNEPSEIITGHSSAALQSKIDPEVTSAKSKEVDSEERKREANLNGEIKEVSSKEEVIASGQKDVRSTANKEENLEISPSAVHEGEEKREITASSKENAGQAHSTDEREENLNGSEQLGIKNDVNIPEGCLEREESTSNERNSDFAENSSKQLNGNAEGDGEPQREQACNFSGMQQNEVVTDSNGKSNPALNQNQANDLKLKQSPENKIGAEFSEQTLSKLESQIISSADVLFEGKIEEEEKVNTKNVGDKGLAIPFTEDTGLIIEKPIQKTVQNDMSLSQQDQVNKIAKFYENGHEEKAAGLKVNDENCQQQVMEETSKNTENPTYLKEEGDGVNALVKAAQQEYEEIKFDIKKDPADKAENINLDLTPEDKSSGVIAVEDPQDEKHAQPKQKEDREGKTEETREISVKEKSSDLAQTTQENLQSKIEETCEAEREKQEDLSEDKENTHLIQQGKEQGKVIEEANVKSVATALEGQIVKERSLNSGKAAAQEDQSEKFQDTKIIHDKKMNDEETSANETKSEVIERSNEKLIDEDHESTRDHVAKKESKIEEDGKQKGSAESLGVQAQTVSQSTQEAKRADVDRASVEFQGEGDNHFEETTKLDLTKEDQLTRVNGKQDVEKSESERSLQSLEEAKMVDLDKAETNSLALSVHLEGIGDDLGETTKTGLNEELKELKKEHSDPSLNLRSAASSLELAEENKSTAQPTEFVHQADEFPIEEKNAKESKQSGGGACLQSSKIEKDFEGRTSPEEETGKKFDLDTTPEIAKNVCDAKRKNDEKEFTEKKNMEPSTSPIESKVEEFPNRPNLEKAKQVEDESGQAQVKREGVGQEITPLETSKTEDISKSGSEVETRTEEDASEDRSASDLQGSTLLDSNEPSENGLTLDEGRKEEKVGKEGANEIPLGTTERTRVEVIDSPKAVGKEEEREDAASVEGLAQVTQISESESSIEGSSQSNHPGRMVAGPVEHKQKELEADERSKEEDNLQGDSETQSRTTENISEKTGQVTESPNTAVKEERKVDATSVKGLAQVNQISEPESSVEGSSQSNHPGRTLDGPVEHRQTGLEADKRSKGEDKLQGDSETLSGTTENIPESTGQVTESPKTAAKEEEKVNATSVEAQATQISELESSIEGSSQSNHPGRTVASPMEHTQKELEADERSKEEDKLQGDSETQSSTTENIPERTGQATESPKSVAKEEEKVDAASVEGLAQATQISETESSMEGNSQSNRAGSVEPQEKELHPDERPKEKDKLQGANGSQQANTAENIPGANEEEREDLASQMFKREKSSEKGKNPAPASAEQFEKNEPHAGEWPKEETRGGDGNQSEVNGGTSKEILQAKTEQEDVSELGSSMEEVSCTERAPTGSADSKGRADVLPKEKVEDPIDKADPKERADGLPKKEDPNEEEVAEESVDSLDAATKLEDDQTQVIEIAKPEGSRVEVEASEKSAPFYLHQDSYRKSPTTSQEKAFAEALKNASSAPTETESGERLLHSSEFHDSLPLKFPSEKAAMDATTHSRPSLLAHSGELHDNIIPLVLQMNDAPAGTEAVTSGREASVGVGAQASHDKDVSADTTQQQHSQPSPGMDTEKRNNSAIVRKSMEAEAATKIQASFRGYQVRKQLKSRNTGGAISSNRRSSRRKSSGRISDSKRAALQQNKNPSQLEQESATKIQAGIRGFLVRRRQKKEKKSKTPESG